MVKFEVISYDVWGNEKDGYEVNQAFNTGHEIEVSEEMTDEEIIEALKEIDFLSDKCNTKTVETDGDDLTIYLKWNKDGYPLCELRRIGE